MKLFLLTALVLGLGISTVLGNPITPQSTPAWHKIGESELGPIYSSSSPTKRDSASWYQVGENRFGAIYSSIPPATVSQRDSQASSKTLADYTEWIAEQ